MRKPPVSKTLKTKLRQLRSLARLVGYPPAIGLCDFGPTANRRGCGHYKRWILWGPGCVAPARARTLLLAWARREKEER